MGLRLGMIRPIHQGRPGGVVSRSYTLVGRRSGEQHLQQHCGNHCWPGGALAPALRARVVNFRATHYVCQNKE